MNHGKTLVILVLGLAFVESRGKPEKKNTPTNSDENINSISKKENETWVVFVAEATELKNENRNNNNNNNKFRNNHTSNELKNISKMKKRSTELNEGDSRIVSLDYDLIDKVWPQEYIDGYKKKKQGMSGSLSPVLSVLCYLTCLM